MKNIKNYFSKLLLIVLTVLLSIGIVGCDKDDNKTECEKNGHTWVDATTEQPKHCTVCGATEGEPLQKPKPVVGEVEISIGGNSSVKSGQTIKLISSISGTDETKITWSITSGSEFATIDQEGNLTAKEVSEDKTVTVKLTCDANEEIYATKTITVIAKPILTDNMLEVLNDNYLRTDGYIKIDVYTMGLFETYQTTSTITVSTAMDGVNWSAEYEDATTGSTRRSYYKNNNGIASEVGVSLMNEEEFFPLEDDFGNPMNWEDAGLYNSLKGLKASDFTLNEDTWYYEYTGKDETLTAKVLAATNPYDFLLAENATFQLVIEDKEVVGIKMISDWDYTIVSGYKAKQELTSVFTLGEDEIEVPTIGKFEHKDKHDALTTAINNMHSANSYTLNYKAYIYNMLASGYTGEGFDEIITSDVCYFTPYEIEKPFTNQEKIVYDYDDTYGFYKFSENHYNSFVKDTNGSFTAARSFNSDFKNAKPSFMFAAEIFTYYYEDENGEITYYVNDDMAYVATTYYYGVGNDINLYGIYATRGYTSTTSSFTPYVTVKDGYITEAGFYFNMGYMYGVITLTYSSVNETKMPEDVTINFTKRENPSSWSDFVFSITDGTADGGYKEVNAADYFKDVFGSETAVDNIPFINECLGDTFGFGLESIKASDSDGKLHQVMSLYYDVPLDVNYSIESSLKKIEDFLISKGFEKNSVGEFRKGDIVVLPADVELDLMVYIWRAE